MRGERKKDKEPSIIVNRVRERNISRYLFAVLFIKEKSLRPIKHDPLQYANGSSVRLRRHLYAI